MFKSFQDTSALQQFHSFPNLNMQQATSAYGFSGVSFWLDAAYGLNTQTNLGAVSRWQARAGGAIFEQATAGNQPRLILNDANYNNLPSVETISYRLMTSTIGLRLNPNTTIAVVSKVNTANPQNVIIRDGGQNTIHDGGTTAGFNGFGNNDATTGQFQGTTESTNPRIKILTSTNIIVNGVIETTGTRGVTATELTVIMAGPTVAFPYVGTLAEIIAFGYSMTSDEAIALSNNINQKYAIY